MVLYPSNRNPASIPFPHTSPQSLPLQNLLLQLQTVLPSFHPIPRWLAGNMKCMHWPLRTKERKRKEKWWLCLQQAPSTSSGQKKNPVAFHCWMLHGRVIPTLALSAQEPSLRSRLHSSASEAPIAVQPAWPIATKAVLATFASLLCLPVLRWFLSILC